VYGFNPRAPIDLVPLLPSEMTCFDASQRSEFVLKMHETTKLNNEKMNEKYHIAASKGRKEIKLEPGDLVWLHLRKERFPELRKYNLCLVLLVLLKFLLRSMIMHINLSCHSSSGLVPTLIFQICDHSWEKKMRYRRGSRQCMRGSMMRTSILRLQSFLPLRYLALSHDHEHNN
jgi:hypothetical protein